MDKNSFRSLLAAILLSGMRVASQQQVREAVETADLILQETGKLSKQDGDDS